MFVSTAQDKSSPYPSHSYNTTLGTPPNPVSLPQEDLGGTRKNGDPNVQNHAVINFTTATTNEAITMHAGTSIESRDLDFCAHSE